MDTKTSAELGIMAAMIQGISAMLTCAQQEYLNDEKSVALRITAEELAERLSRELTDIVEHCEYVVSDEKIYKP